MTNTTYTYDENIFSDLYKEVFGFRPRGHEFYTANPAAKQVIWDQLLIQHERVMKEYHAAQQEGIARFEMKVVEIIELGAKDRETAIRWMSDEEVYGVEYLEYAFNLPYGYLRPQA